ncbi:MAG: DUF2235 domain-containing protein [Alcaligenaceae bacterium]|nr:DUF2235 domain-containing protein [Alcaligenaceae bacterium]
MRSAITSAFAILALISAFTPLQTTLAQGTGGGSSAEPPCNASTAGNPCYGTGNNAGQDKSGANPVNLTNGNKFQEELDFIGAEDSSGLEFYRYYNSTQLTPSLIGQGWRHSYSRKLYWQGQRPQILLDDSTRILFEPLEDNSTKSLYDEYGHLNRITLASVMERLNEAGNIKAQDKKSLSEYFSNNYIASLRGDLWLWQYPSGALDIFDAKGNLIISQMPSSEAVFIEREIKPGPSHGAILSVQNRNQKRLDFHYETLGDTVRLSQINTPRGSLEFQHDLPSDEKTPRLLAVSLADGAKITYEYRSVAKGFDEQLSAYLIERARHFISDAVEPYRDISWRYNAQNRAVKVIFHRHDELNRPLSMLLDYVKIPQHNGDSGVTEVTQIIGETSEAVDSAGPRRTLSRFHTAMQGSQYLLTKAEGAPCFKCPTPGTEVEYNEAGYMTSFNGLDIKRDAQNNRIDSIGVAHRGWPGLRIFYDNDGKPYAWSSLHTGKTFFELDPDTLYPKYKNYANGTRMYSQYRANTRAWSTAYKKHPGNPDIVNIRSSLQKIGYTRHVLSNDVDQKIISIKKFSQTLEHGTVRSWFNRKRSSLKDEFTPSYENKLVEHKLPESGKLHYKYDENNQLKSIYWETANADKNDNLKLVYQRLNAYERRYGNNLLLLARKNSSTFQYSTKLELLKKNEDFPYWQEIRHYHKNGLLAAEHNLSSALDINKYRQYEFNPYGQMIRVDTVQHNPNSQSSETDLYAWQLGGAAFARQTTNKIRKNDSIEKQESLILKKIERDKSGLIQRMDKLQLIYNEEKLLSEIKKDGQTVANYAYDGLKHRTGKNTSEGETQYYYLNQQLVAEAFIPASSSDKKFSNTWNERPHITRRYIYDDVLPVAMIDYSTDMQGQLYYIHSDSVGQPFLVTDETQQAVWLSNNDTFGQSHPVIEDIEFNLRLPGQYYDKESGLHQNIYRYYDPEAGHYLEPDPLGPVGDNEVFGYAHQNPRQFVDPLGLLMFIFDGTTNTPTNQTNAYKLGQLYKEDKVYYLEGLGTKESQTKIVDFFSNYHREMNSTRRLYESSMLQRMYALSLLEWWVPEFITSTTPDKLYGDMAPYLLNMQWMRLIEEMSKVTSTGLLLDQTYNIDLSGFSRGAALASIFANKIAEYTTDHYFQYKAKWLPPGQQDIKVCVNLRFVGLFDTVHQLGTLGRDNKKFSYTVAQDWALYAHAVALNEHRAIMTLTRYKDENTTNVEEYGFLGNHSDIGGSLFTEDLTDSTNPSLGTYSDLGNIPLAWIYDKATQANVPLKNLSDLSHWQLDTVKNPLVHLNHELMFMVPNTRWLLADRKVYSASGKYLGRQARLKDLGYSARAEHFQFLDYLSSSKFMFTNEQIRGLSRYGLVRADEYLKFLKNAIELKSSLNVISQQQ